MERSQSSLSDSAKVCSARAVNSAENKAFLIGSPVSHSKSPELHNAAYFALGLHSWYYGKIEVTPDTLPAFIEMVRQDDSIRGMSVTMPLKNDIIPLLDSVSELALSTGAVNTVYKREVDGEVKLFGDNTDVEGIVGAFSEQGIESVGRCLILGNGATSRSAAAAAELMGASVVKIAARREPRDLNLGNLDDLAKEATSSDIIISALPWEPAGEFLPQLSRAIEAMGGELPVMLECAHPKKLETSIDGSRMLLHQALRQVELMTEKTVTSEVFGAMERARV